MSKTKKSTKNIKKKRTNDKKYSKRMYIIKLSTHINLPINILPQNRDKKYVNTQGREKDHSGNYVHVSVKLNDKNY